MSNSFNIRPAKPEAALKRFAGGKTGDRLP